MCRPDGSTPKRSLRTACLWKKFRKPIISFQPSWIIVSNPFLFLRQREFKCKIMENTANNHEHIKGWGVDANPQNEPTYPMKKYTGDDHNRLNWVRPPLQPVTVEILHSNERPNIS